MWVLCFDAPCVPLLGSLALSGWLMLKSLALYVLLLLKPLVLSLKSLSSPLSVSLVLLSWVFWKFVALPGSHVFQLLLRLRVHRPPQLVVKLIRAA